MRVLALVGVVLCSCAAQKADIDLKPGFTFMGPRAITITSGNEDDVAVLTKVLTARGFQVDRNKTNGRSESGSKYGLALSGVCQTRTLEYGGGYRGAPTRLPELKAEAFDAATSQRIFTAHLGDNQDCPGGFFNDLVDALDHAWEGAASAPDAGH